MRIIGVFQNKASQHHKCVGVAASFLFLLPVFVYGAEYQGQNVDGTAYFAFAHSLQTGKYYPATVVFDHDHVNVHLESGKKLELTLDEQDVDDPDEVIAIDPFGRWWALSIDGLDEPSGSKVSLADLETS